MNDERQPRKWRTIARVFIVIAVIIVLVAIAIPSFVKARNTSCQNACINNLRMIDSGKIPLAAPGTAPQPATRSAE